MRINIELLRDIYDYMIENENIYKLNEYLGLEDNETPTFEDFKEYFKSMIIADLQYDFDVRMNMNNLIEEER